jgi:pimeloyl-ACP methyl ester carboxylesterase
MRAVKIKGWKVATLLGVLLLLPPFYVAARTFQSEYASFRAPPRRVVAQTLRDRLPTQQEVSWQSDRYRIRGSFTPGGNRAAIVLLHGSGGNRMDLLTEAELFSRRGFSVLAFDWPGHGESEGQAEWGDAERAALRASIDWLSERPEVDRRRIGALGFSMGGVPLIQEAARDPRIRAVGVASTPGNLETFARWEYRRYGVLTQWPAMLAMLARGMRLWSEIPREVVPKLAPRPLLVIVCEKDDIVPPLLTRSLYENALEPKELLPLLNASHGEYAVDISVYSEHLLSFYARALLTTEGAP